MIKVLIIGGGFAGCSAAHVLSEKSWDITLVENAPFLGAGCKTFYYGGHPHTFGPRHFLTKNEKVFEFLNKYVPLRPLQHEFLTYVEEDGQFYHFPINKLEVLEIAPDRALIRKELENLSEVDKPKNLEEYWKAKVGPTLYRKFIENYTRKMWQIEPREFDDISWSVKGVAIKTGKEKVAWSEAFSGFPEAPNGYDDYFKIATKDVTVLLETKITEFDIENYKVKFNNDWYKYDIIVNTISPEIILNNAFGPLRWMGRRLEKLVFPVKEVFPNNVYFLYFANNEPFLRMVEYKKFYACDKDSPTTLICLEFPQVGRRDYPYPILSEKAKAQKYFDALPEKVFSIGRAGSYDYRVDIDDCIEQALELEKIV